MEQANLLAYKYHVLWLEKLMMCRLDSVPQGFSKPTFQQLEAADKRLFLLLAEKTRAGIKATAQGRPCDAKFEDCMNSTEVLSILQPKPVAVRAKDDEQPLTRQKTEKPQFANSLERPSNKGKGKGKTKQGSSQFMRVPSDLLSLGCVGATPQGHRLCSRTIQFEEMFQFCQQPEVRQRASLVRSQGVHEAASSDGVPDET
eukprot:s1913_g2.t1